MTEVKVPKKGITSNEALVTDIHVSVGDHVAVGQSIVTLEMDKATFTVGAPVEGRIAGLPSATNSSVTVGSIVALIEEGDS